MDSSGIESVDAPIHHSFFPIEAQRMEDQIRRQLGIDVQVVISPRLDKQHNPLLKEQDVPFGAEGLSSPNKHNVVYISPNAAGAFERYLDEKEKTADGFIELDSFISGFTERTQRFLDIHKGNKNSELYPNLEQLVEIIGKWRANRENSTYESLYREHILIRWKVLSHEGRDPAYTTFFSEVILPLAHQYPSFFGCLKEEMDGTAYHEAGHILLNQIVQDKLLTEEELAEVNKFMTSQVIRRMEAFNAPTHLIHHFQDLDEPKGEREAIKYFRRQGDEKIAILLKLIKNPALKKKVAFTVLWRGFDEDTVRGIQQHLTHQRLPYTISTLHFYFSSASALIWGKGGNESICEAAQIFEEKGLTGLKEFISTTISDIDKAADRLVEIVRDW